MTKAVVFDLDGVYFLNGTEKFITSICEKFNLEREKVAEVYLKSEMMQKYKRGEIDGSIFWSYAIETWGIDSNKDEIISILLNGYEENPDAVKILNEVRAKGLKTAICTNNYPERLEGLINKFSLNEKFDVIIASYQEKITKPDPQIFNILSDKLELKPEEIFISDDRQENVDSLKSLGFNAHFYTGIDVFNNI